MNRNDGFALDNSSYNNLSDNRAITNTRLGFGLWDSNFNNLTNNSGVDNMAGFYLQDSQHNNLTINNAINNTIDGFWLNNADNKYSRQTMQHIMDGMVSVSLIQIITISLKTGQ